MLKTAEDQPTTFFARLIPSEVKLTLEQTYSGLQAEDYANVINGLAPIHAAYFEAGGMGIVIGDGQLNYGLEQTQGDAQVFAKRMIARYRRTPPG